MDKMKISILKNVIFFSSYVSLYCEYITRDFYPVDTPSNAPLEVHAILSVIV